MNSLSQLHAAAGFAMLGAAAAFAIAALVASAAKLAPWWLEWGRLGLAGLAVVAAAIGTVIAVRDSGPSDALHWLYGAVLVAVPVLVASPEVGESARRRSGLLGLSGVLMALLAWRLTATG